MELENITLYGNLSIDFFHMEEQSINNENIFVSNYIPKLTNNSKALITFDNDNNNLNGISDSALDYTFSVYREENSSNKLKNITRIKDGRLSIIDYNIVNQRNYKYHIFKEDDNIISATNISNDIDTCWWNWSITGLTKSDTIDNEYLVNPNDIWLFNLNVDSADVVRNFNKTEYKNLTKYPKFSIGKSNYASGSLTCLIGQIRNNKYLDTPEMLDVWNEFCNNSQLKLLKDRKGHKMLVEIVDSSSNVLDETQEQATTINFSWKQLGDTNDMTIIEE